MGAILPCAEINLRVEASAAEMEHSILWAGEHPYLACKLTITAHRLPDKERPDSL